MFVCVGGIVGGSPVLWFRPSGLCCPLCLCFSNWLTESGHAVRGTSLIIHLSDSNNSAVPLYHCESFHNLFCPVFAGDVRDTVLAMMESHYLNFWRKNLFGTKKGQDLCKSWSHYWTAPYMVRTQFTCTNLYVNTRLNALSKNNQCHSCFMDCVQPVCSLCRVLTNKWQTYMPVGDQYVAG